MLSLGLLAASLALAGCAGYRGGWESVAMSATHLRPAWTNRSSASAPRLLQSPGPQLQVSIDNQLRTDDTQVYLFVVPLVLDAREVYAANHVAPHALFVSVTLAESFAPVRSKEGYS